MFTIRPVLGEPTTRGGDSYWEVYETETSARNAADVAATLEGRDYVVHELVHDVVSPYADTRIIIATIKPGKPWCMR